MKHVLVVEDDAWMRSLLEQAAAGADREVRSVGSAEEALGLSWTPDLVVCDERLPGMHGTRLIEALRGKHGREIPFLVCSGDPVRLPALPLAEFTPKPIDPAAIQQTIARLLGTGPRFSPLPPEALAALRDGYLRSLPGRLEKAIALAERATSDPASAEALVDELHRLAGSGESHDVGWVTTTARELHDALSHAPPGPLSPEQGRKAAAVFRGMMSKIGSA